MYPTRITKPAFQRKAFIGLTIVLILWLSGQATSLVAASNYQDGLASVVEPVSAAIVGEPAPEIVTASSLASPITEVAEEAQDWFIVDEESRWSDQELMVVRQIMDHTWEALEKVGLDGEGLLEGYRFRRVQAEFVPGEERLLAIVDHQKMEIVLADGAFKRLGGFYIYHELGHAIDRQLERLPSEAYHRIAGEGQGKSPEGSDTWMTTTGFWLRYPGRDDREEATADAFAWWVMDQAGQTQPFFPGTPVTTDYADVAQAIEDALRTVTASARS